MEMPYSAQTIFECLKGIVQSAFYLPTTVTTDSIRSTPRRRSLMFQLMRRIIPGQLGDRAAALFVTVGLPVVLEKA